WSRLVQWLSMKVVGWSAKEGGLGAGRYLSNPSLRERRGLLAQVLISESEKMLVEHSAGLVRQGIWTHWNAVRPFDLSWKNLLSTQFCLKLHDKLCANSGYATSVWLHRN